MLRGYRRVVLVFAALALGWLLLPSSSDVTAQPAPVELTRLCRSLYTGQVRYVAPSQNCTPTEAVLDVVNDQPFTLCVNRFTGAVRYSNTGACTASSEMTLNFPAAQAVYFCVIQATGHLRWTQNPANCPAGSFAAAISQVVPNAVADGPYEVLINTTLTVTTGDPNDLLDNDTLGLPAATLVSFGGGSLGGAVTDNLAGASVALAGGTLTVNADGSFELANPTVTGDYSFQYRIENTAGFDDATVTIQVQQLPDAVDDPDYFLLAGGGLGVGSGSGLLFNDTLGFPAATLVSFGGGTLGGAVTDNVAGTTVSPLPAFADGSLLVNADGSFNFVPPTGFLGDFTFQYRLENAAGFDDATVTIEVRQAPTAVADSYATLINVDLSRATSDPDDLLDNDTLGFPPATISSFGGGSLGGAVTDFAPGTGVTFAGGTLTVNADGSFTLTNPTTPGDHTFLYRLSNIVGSSDATVTIQVQEPPTAVIDSYTTLVNVTLDVPDGATDLLSNDGLGFPPATLTSFGGGDLGGAVTDNAAGDSDTLAGGTLTVNTDGSFTLSNPTISGDYTFDYRLTNVAGSSDATVSIQVQAAPDAVDDSFTVLIFVTLNGDLNDDNGNGPDDLGFPAAVISTIGGGDLGGNVGSNPLPASLPLAGGTLNVDSDGTFSLVNPTVPGDYTFEYRLQNLVGFDDATVSIQVRQLPDAVDDSFAVNIGAALNGDLNDDNGSGLDILGFPPATLTGFGGGDLGGAVTDNAPGDSVPLAGGTLTVDADGAFSLTGADTPGLYTFQYRLANAAGSDDATVTINVQAGPDAIDDSFTVLVGAALNGDLNDDNGNGPDILGVPPATLTFFGGGSLGGTVTSNAAGASVGLAGGTLTVNADGTFSLTGATVPGDYTFLYRLENAAGSDDATVSIQVQQGPTAVDDGPYGVEIGTTLIITTADLNDLLDNDLPGFPTPATITSFGGGDLGGAVTTNNPGDTVAVLASGGVTVQVNADGSFTVDATSGTPVAGTYTFDYRLTNAAGLFDDATVTLQVQDVPDAVDDAFTTTVGGPDLNGDLNDDNGNGPDDLGTPAATVTSFGGGDLGGAVTDNPTPDTAALAGGTLTVNADGTFSLTGVTTGGIYTFLYRLENTAGFDDATVTITVQQAPLAVADGPAADSIPGEPFHTAADTTLNSATSGNNENLLDNDTLGFPAATLTFFGGGDLGGVVTDHAAGTTVAPLPQGSGSLQVNADGSFVFTPPTSFAGLYTFDYRITNAVGTSDATVTIAVGERPAALNDDYDTVANVLGNVFIDTSFSSNFNVLTNDQGDGLTFTSLNLTSTQGGQVTLQLNGTFTYNPPPGYEGPDSFTYEIDNAFNDPSQGTVNLTVADMIWFIDASAPAGGDGRFLSPFNCLVSATCFSTLAADDPGDSIFLASGAYTGGLTLLANQLFVGEGASQDLSTITGLTPPADSPALPATGGARPTITTSNLDAITLGNTNLIRGMDVGNTGTGTGITGTGFGTLTLSEVSIIGTGRAINLDTGTADVTLDSVTSNTGGAQGINLNLVDGAFTVSNNVDIDATTGDGIAINDSPATIQFQGTVNVDNAGANGIDLTGNTNGPITFASIDLDAITSVGLNILNNDDTVTVNGGSIGATDDPGGNAVDIQGGTANVTVAASITKTTAGEVVDVTLRIGGISTFSGAVTCNAGCTGINIFDNGGGEERFTGAVSVNTGAEIGVNSAVNSGSHAVSFSGGLDIATTSGTAFNITSGRIEVLNGSVTSTVTSTTGIAVNIVNATIANSGGASVVDFDSVNASGPVTGIQLTNTGSGAFTANGGSIANATSRGVDVDGGTGNVTYAGTISTTAAGRSVEVTNHTGGTVLFSGAIDDNGLGVNLATNGGATLRFTGGLDIDTVGANTGFNATGAGTLEVLDPAIGANTINTTAGTGVGLLVSGVTFGAGDATFESINTTGAAQGINLANTGTAGNLVVTGAGANDSGGVILNSTTDGIRLNNSNGAVLNEMRVTGSTDNNVEATSVIDLTLTSISLQNSGNDGFSGNTVRNLSITNSSITGSGDAALDDGIQIENLHGASAITGTTFQDNSVIHLFVRNANAFAAPDVLTLSGNTFSLPTAGLFGDAVSIESNTTGNLRVVMNTSVGNNVFTGGITGLHAIAASAGDLEVQVTQATISGLTGTGVNLDGNGAGSVINFNVGGVTMTQAQTIGINATSINGAVLNGTIHDNSVTGAPLPTPNAGTGITAIVEGNGSMVVEIDNNDISEIRVDNGIRIQARAGNGRIDATVTNNTVDNDPAQDPLNNPPLEGIHVESGSSAGGDTNTICLNMANNNSVAETQEGFRVRARVGTTFQLQDFTGNGAVAGDVQNWITVVKSNVGTTIAQPDTAFIAAPVACTTPSF